MWTRKRHGRRKGFARLRKIVKAAGMADPTIVETGTLRSDTRLCRIAHGWSTVFFCGLVHEVGGQLHTVDKDERAVATGRSVIARMFGEGAGVHFHVSDSVAFLRSFGQPVDILYLDSYDYDPREGPAAALHQLAEVRAALDKLTPGSIVMVDDLYGGPSAGKGALSIPFLKHKGWTLIEVVPVAERRGEPWCQAILRRPGSGPPGPAARRCCG